MSIPKLERPNLSTTQTRLALQVRSTPHYQLITYGRHIGYLRDPRGDAWYARVRTRKGSYYRRRLGLAQSPTNPRGLDYHQALILAKEWFASAKMRPMIAPSREIGVRQTLLVCPLHGSYSVSHAVQEYVEWKRIAAAKSHFEANLSLINHHIVPLLGNVLLEAFSMEHMRNFVRSVLETPPKRGNQPLGPRRPISSLSDEELRRRKKTANTLIGILRLSFQLAWEGGKIPNDRPIRCLRRLPAVDRPRTLHLSRSECRELLANCRPDLARLVLGALYTGCRAAELVSMRCEDVGRDGYGIYIHPLKNYRPRFVFLPDEGMAWFLELVQGKMPKDYVFTRDNGKPWYDYKHPFKIAVREAALPDEFSFHGLRHTYASQLVQAGATVYAVAEQLGHANATSVLRTYGHLSPQMRESEVRQRFTTVSPANGEYAMMRAEHLRQWRSSLHGSDWREYAKIHDVPRQETEEEVLASLRPRRILQLGRARD